MSNLGNAILTAASEYQPPPSKRTLKDEVMFNLDAIDAARRQGMPYEEIAKIFTAQGHEIAATTLQEYHRRCRAELSPQKPKRRRSSAQKPSVSPEKLVVAPSPLNGGGPLSQTASGHVIDIQAVT